MAKRGRPSSRKRQAAQRNRGRQARTARGRHQPGTQARDLLAEVRSRLATGEPVDFLAYVSTLLAALDPRGKNPFEPADEDAEHATLPMVIESFSGVMLPETTALLAALTQLGPDELTRARVSRARAARPHPLPDWLARLGETSVYRAVESTHVLGDGDSVLLGARLPGHELTAVIYIDHNLGTVVKDAFPVSGPVSAVLDRMAGIADDPDLTVRDLSLADARARISEAIEVGAMTYPPFETETWPASRPLTEWLLRLLPAGGTGYIRPDWDEAAKQRLASRFFASEFGAGLDSADHRGLLDDILWFGTGYGPGDPLRWSPVAVELLLTDWIPRKIVESPQYLRKAPALLRAFIRFCHAERAIRPSLTGETLAAVDVWEPEYQRIIRSPRPQGPMALLAAVSMARGGEGWDELSDGELSDDGEPFAAERHLLGLLAEEVGGSAALDALDDAPLPAEEFGWDQVPADVRDRVGQVLAGCDRCSDELLGAEYKTACRRLLARAVPGLGGMLAGPAKAEGIAAAVCWVIAKGNERFGYRPGELRVKDLTAYFGLAQTSVAERGYQIMRAAGISPGGGYGHPLHSPDLLVSARRRRILELRDRHCAAMSDNPTRPA